MGPTVQRTPTHHLHVDRVVDVADEGVELLEPRLQCVDGPSGYGTQLGQFAL